MGYKTRAQYDLKAWEESITLVKIVYKITKSFPDEELYGLTAQMRRAAVSIASNVAEGAARGSTKGFARFLSISKGSLSELETQLIIAVELGYMEKDNEGFEQINYVSKLVTGLHKSIT